MEGTKMSSAPIEVCPVCGSKFTLYCPECNKDAYYFMFEESKNECACGTLIPEGATQCGACKEDNYLEWQHKEDVKSFDGWD